jgi:predicted PurR-regulated permease PerM
VASPSGDRAAREQDAFAPEPGRPVRLRPTWSVVGLVALGLLAVVVGRNVFEAAHRIIGWGVAASVVAVLLTPLVQLLDRWLPRPLAFLGTFVAVLVAAVAIGYGIFGDLRTQVDRIREAAPDAAANIEERDDRIGELARDIGLTDRVDAFVEALDERVGSGGEALASAALSFPPYFVSGILTIFLMIYGERIVRAGVDEIRDPHRRRRVHRAVTDTARRGRRYILTAIAQSVVVATTVWAGCHLLEVPAPVVLAVIASVLALVPYLGVVLAWAPVLLLGLGFTSVARVAVVAAGVVALQVAEAWWWRPRVDAATLHVGPFVPVVVGLLGFEIYGIGGALYGVALAVFVMAFADAVSEDDEPVPTPVDEFEPDPDPDPEPDPGPVRL